MPDDPADHCPPDSENNTPEAPAVRPAPLQSTDKADVGCLITLFVMFIGVFLFPAVMFLGGAPLIVPLIVCLLLILVTPFVNPTERRSVSSKWWGRVITFLILAVLILGVWYWKLGRKKDDQPFDVRQQGRIESLLHARQPASGWS
jgi:hypothetical protein